MIATSSTVPRPPSAAEPSATVPGWTLATRPPWITARPVSKGAPAAGRRLTAGDLLRENTAFPPRLKWTSSPGDLPELRLDILSESEDPGDYLPAAASAIGGDPAASFPAVGSLDPHPAPEPAVLVEMAIEAGWEARLAGPENAIVIVSLDLPAAPPARIEFHSRHGLEIRFDYPGPIHAADESALHPEAVAWARSRLLLHLGHEVRLVVPAREEDGSFRLRASLPGGALDADRLHDALAAVRLAASLSLREFEALADPELARTYLNSFTSKGGGKQNHSIKP